MNALKTTAPQRNSLYDPAYEHDSCGVGLVAHIKGVPSRAIVDDAYAVLKSMEHRAVVFKAFIKSGELPTVANWAS